MSTKEVEEFCRKLSRKELQTLCKKCGLPARKSSAELAGSLISYLKKKDLNLISSSKSIGGTQTALCPTSSVPILQPEAPLHLTGNAIKDISCLSNKRNRTIECTELDCRGRLKSYDEVDFCGSFSNFLEASQSQFFPPCVGSNINNKQAQITFDGRETHFHCTDVNRGSSLKENACPFIEMSAKEPASFEFYVSSEEGIKLCVDLDSSPSDWIKKYRNQVSLCDNLRGTMSQSLHQELGQIGQSNKQMKSSFLKSLDHGQIRDVHLQAGSSPSLLLGENSNVGSGLPDGAYKKIICDATLDESECLEEDSGPISSKPISIVQDQIICNTKSCCQNSFGAILDSITTDNQVEKTACNFGVNSNSDGSVDLGAVEHQNSRNEDEICNNSALQNNCNLKNTIFGYMASHPIDMHLSEAGNYCKYALCPPNENGKFLDIVNPKCSLGPELGALGSSSENDVCRNHLPSCSEERVLPFLTTFPCTCYYKLNKNY